MCIQERVHGVRQRIDEAARAAGRDPKEVVLCAATKVQSDEAIRAAIAAGISVCGETRVQELTAHLEHHAYEGAEVHFIGHLQTNKVNKVVGKVALIHSVDSERLLRAIEQQAAKLDIRQDILLEVNIGDEESKSGFHKSELAPILERMEEFSGIRVRGLMAIPPICENSTDNHKFFQEMCQIAVDIKEKKYHNVCVDIMSMGMSGDYADAIACGSTMIRVGTAIFGARNYQ